MTGNDTLLLVITGSVAGEFENLSCEVFKDGSEVDWRMGIAESAPEDQSQKAMDY